MATKKRTYTIIAGATISLALVAAFVFLALPQIKEKREYNKHQKAFELIWEACDQSIQNQAKYPATVNYPNGASGDIEETEEKYITRIVNDVDMANMFGTPTRYRFDANGKIDKDLTNAACRVALIKP